jgi:holo-[acyl-carrier protein] synthase
MIFGIGVDILRQERMEKVWTRHGDKLVQRILCEAEREEFAQSSKPLRFLTMSFAAKEACVKALGTGFSGVGYRDIGSVREVSGRPVLVFSAKLQKRLTRLGIVSSHLSLSDEGGLVCAMVVLEC